MGEWECAHCGHIAVGDAAPGRCPECGSPPQTFVFFAYPDASDWEEEDRFLGLDIPALPPYVPVEDGSAVELTLSHPTLEEASTTEPAPT